MNSYVKYKAINKSIKDTTYVWCYICNKYDCRVWNHAK